MFLPTMPNSPRTLHRLIVVRAIVASAMLGGCVEATAYEQATSAAEVQAEARRRLSAEYAGQKAELTRLRAEQQRLQAENQRLAALLAEREGTIDQAQLDLVLATQEKHQEATLVQQLRGDLARVGSDLDVFADEKAGLGAELTAARAENAKLAARLAEAEAASQAETAAAPNEVAGEQPVPRGGATSDETEAAAEPAPPPLSPADED